MKLLCPAGLLCLFLTLASAPALGAEAEAREAVHRVEEEWANIFYRLPLAAQATQLAPLLPRLQALAQRYPAAAEPLIMEALVLCALAAADAGLSSLGRVERARDLLVKSLRIDPLAMDGSADITLGNLYYRLPGWPISYGDDELARQHLETAIQRFPDAVDTNYFYGDYLLEQGEFSKALPYLEKAEKAPVRPLSRLSDLQLKQELRQALKDAREENSERSNFFSRLLKAVME